MRNFHAEGIKTCMELLDELTRGEVKGGFFELNVCKGGCVKGPAAERWKRSMLKCKAGSGASGEIYGRSCAYRT